MSTVEVPQEEIDRINTVLADNQMTIQSLTEEIGATAQAHATRVSELRAQLTRVTNERDTLKSQVDMANQANVEAPKDPNAPQEQVYDVSSLPQG